MTKLEIPDAHTRALGLTYILVIVFCGIFIQTGVVYGLDNEYVFVSTITHQSPFYICVDSSDNIYATDQVNHNIHKYNSLGQAVTPAWGQFGTGNLEFNKPIGVAADINGFIYITDFDNNRVQKLNPDGTFIKTWGKYGTDNGQFNQPRGIAVDNSGFIYVVDSYNQRVQKFTADGGYVTSWGGPGSTDGKFSSPSGIAIDANGDIYVTDVFNHRVQKFNSAGVFISKIGGVAGLGDGEFVYPYGVTVDNSGYIWVADTGNKRVQKFDPSGTFNLKLFYGVGIGEGRLSSPVGVAVDSAGDLYVSDTYGIQKYSQVKTGSIEIRVQDSSGTPLGGALVTSVIQPTNQLSGVTEYTAGIIEFTGVEPGKYVFNASLLPVYLQVQSLAITVVAGETAKISIILSNTDQQKANFRVKIIDEFGESVEGANIITLDVTPGGTNLNLISDVNGYATEYGLIPGSYKFQASKTGFKTVEEKVLLQGGELTQFFIRLLSPPRVQTFRFDLINSPKYKEIDFEVVITAIDQYNEPFPNYNGMNSIGQRLSFDQADVSPTTIGPFINGVWRGKIKVLDHLESMILLTASIEYPGAQGESNTFRVAEKPPAGLHHFEIDPITSPQAVGVPFTIKVYAKTQTDALLSDYNGGADLSISDYNGGADPNISYGTLSPTRITFNNGIATASVTINSIGIWVYLKVTEGTATGQSNFFEVAQSVPGGFFTLTITKEGAGRADALTQDYGSLSAGEEAVTHNYPSGTVVTLRAGDADDGWFFAGWTYVDESRTVGDRTITITMTKNIKMLAKFQKNSAPLLPGCFIALATYGSELSSEVQMLRNFRDKTALNTFAGSKFMSAFNKLYYSFSPTIASTIRENDALRNLMKVALYPLINVMQIASNSYQLFNSNPEFGVVAVGFIASTLLAIVYLLPITLIASYLTNSKLSTKLIKIILLIWIVSVGSIAAAELIKSPTIMMASTGAYVLTTICLTVLVITKVVMTWVHTRNLIH